MIGLGSVPWFSSFFGVLNLPLVVARFRENIRVLCDRNYWTRVKQCYFGFFGFYHRDQRAQRRRRIQSITARARATADLSDSAALLRRDGARGGTTATKPVTSGTDRIWFNRHWIFTKLINKLANWFCGSSRGKSFPIDWTSHWPHDEFCFGKVFGDASHAEDERKSGQGSYHFDGSRHWRCLGEEILSIFVVHDLGQRCFWLRDSHKNGFIIMPYYYLLLLLNFYY